MRSEDDWRLTREEEWMYGAELHFREYKTPTPDWDHAHCSLCWEKFAEKERAEELGALSEGYVVPDNSLEPPRPVEQRTTYHEDLRIVASPTNEEWICQTCFRDFRDRFGWRVVEA